MADIEGALRMQPSSRWAIVRPGHDPIEITSGELFFVEVDGQLRVTRMEHLWGEGYYSVDGYPLRDGMRSGDRRWRIIGTAEADKHAHTLLYVPSKFDRWRPPVRTPPSTPAHDGCCKAAPLRPHLVQRADRCRARGCHWVGRRSAS
jgi:hypothetical protein